MKERELRLARDRYRAAVLAGDRSAASLEVARLSERATPATTIYFELLTPCLVRVGELWHEGAITVAHEHHATQIVLGHIEQIKQLMHRSAGLSVSAIVTCAEGERHAIGARMAADLLEAAGWDVDFLGADTPVPDLVEIVTERSPDLVGISVTMAANVRNVRRATAALKRIARPPRIVVGGAALASLAEADRLIGADAACSSAREFPQIAGELVGAGAPRLALESLLGSVGRRILERRRQLGWSQQRLAASAGIDRTYLSSVEQGRQNVTVAALKKLGDALGVPVSEFLERG